MQSEKCVARCRNEYDAMRMIPASFARVPQRSTGHIYMRLLIIFQAVRMMSKTCNLCFGGRKRNRLFMTASQSVYALYVEAQGNPGG